MRRQGRIARWDGARGFGFIRAAQAEADVFFHIRDFRGNGAPATGMAVSYEEIHVGGKGPRAMAVQPLAHAAGAQRAQRPAVRQPPSRHTAGRAPAAGQALAVALMLGWLGLLGWGVLARGLPWWVPAAVLALNLATFVCYGMDKNAAQRGGWRISERTLHLLALLGGWPAAWWAQQWLRHKSAKQSFRAMYWATVLLHNAALAVLVLRGPELLARLVR